MNAVLVRARRADAIDGGAGFDTASYASSASAVNVGLDGGTQTGGAGSNDDQFFGRGGHGKKAAPW